MNAPFQVVAATPDQQAAWVSIHPFQSNALRTWPEPLSDEALHGLGGEITREIEPNTEADSSAVLLQTLVAFGALVGRGPHVRVEGDEHHLNLFALLVGESSKARKGTSWGRVKELFSKVDGFPIVVNGLSSGEGLKYAVRDATWKQEYDKKTKTTAEVQVDAGVTDKRVLVQESEFSQVLRQVARAGNTLSATLRAAWESGELRTLTKNDPTTATGAHISVIGHITADELRSELTATDSANGFANRFLLMCVRRSKILPFGGDAISTERIAELASRITRAAGTARQRTVVSMTPDARALWASVYPTLSEGHGGLFGAVTARAEAQCLRLALAYAMMNEAGQIQREHLLAAIGVWERAEASAQYIFGSALGDPIADEILRSLKAAASVGLSRTEISKLFKGHQKAERIEAGLALLKAKNRATDHKQATDGRASEIWRAL